MKYFKVAALALALATALSVSGCGQQEAQTPAQTAAAETKETTAEFYAEYPDIPDFGKRFGVDLLKTDKDELSTTYTYERYDGNIDDEADYFQKLKEFGYEMDGDLMRDYLTANENNEAFELPMLYSKNNTVISTARDYDADTFSVIVSDISVYEKLIEDAK